MNLVRSAVRGAALVAVAALAACSERPVEGPPEIRLGHDECIECGMMIAEERCSAAALVESDAGREHRVFDDIGCLLDWEREHAASDEGAGMSVVARFVRDHPSKAWLDAADAVFVDGSRVVTPMASGLLAFRDPAAAESSVKTDGGRVRLWSELHAARLAWIERRNAAMRESAARHADETRGRE